MDDREIFIEIVYDAIQRGEYIVTEDGKVVAFETGELICMVDDLE